MDIVCLDLEGVLVPEIWIEVAENTGIDALKATTRDIPDYGVLMRQRLALLEENGLGLGDIQAVKAKFRAYLEHIYKQHAELFPKVFKGGYILHGFVYSKKQQINTRRIKLVENNEAYQIRPSFLMPYMIARTSEVEKGLYFKRWGVPFEALVYGFGHDAMFWYRAYVSIGRNSIVGTTVKEANKLPENVVADEKHSRLQGQKVYIPTTIAQECILGADIADNAGTKALTEGFYEPNTKVPQ